MIDDIIDNIDKVLKMKNKGKEYFREVEKIAKEIRNFLGEIDGINKS